MAAPDAPPTICTALLQPQDRIPRAPLGAWAGQLRASLAVCLARARTVESLSYEVGTVGNNAALVAAQMGDVQAARRLCETQVWWQLRLARRSGSAAAALHSVQPWVNLARLDGLTGDWPGALSRLAQLDARRPDGTLALRPLRADGVGCQALRAGTGDFAILVENLFAVDSLKALLLNRRWAEVLRFAAELGPGRRPGVAMRALEATVVASCRLGDTEGARDQALEGVRRSEGDPWRRVVFRLRAAEAAACAGDLDRAGAELAPLARGVRALSAGARAQLQTQYVLARLASACYEAGRADDAAALAGDLFQGARASGDEIFQIEAARILAECAGPATRTEWAAVRDGLEGATEYRRYRRRGAPPPDPAPLHALHDDLEALFAA